MVSWQLGRRPIAHPGSVRRARAQGRSLSTTAQRAHHLRFTPTRSPDESKIKTKMLYASSKDALRRSLVGIAHEIQGTDHSEIAYSEGTSAGLFPSLHSLAPRYSSLLAAIASFGSRLRRKGCAG